jgi:hypothetical protein
MLLNLILVLSFFCIENCLGINFSVRQSDGIFYFLKSNDAGNIADCGYEQFKIKCGEKKICIGVALDDPLSKILRSLKYSHVKPPTKDDLFAIAEGKPVFIAQTYSPEIILSFFTQLAGWPHYKQTINFILYGSDKMISLLPDEDNLELIKSFLDQLI